MRHPHPLLRLALGLVLFLTMAAAQARSDGDRFDYPPLDWSMPIPSGWVLEHAGAATDHSRRGAELMEMDPALLAQQRAVVSMKNGDALFAAVLDPKPMAQLSPDLHRALFELSVELISAAMRKSISRIEVGSIESTRIGARDFLWVEFALYADSDSEAAPFARQRMYQSVTERHLLTVTYAGPNEMFAAIDQAWLKSSFGKAQAARRGAD